MNARDILEWAREQGYSAGYALGIGNSSQLLESEKRQRIAERESWKKKLRAAEEERDDFRKRLAEMRAGVARLDQQTNDLLAERTKLRHDLEDARDALKKCATGPWIKGKPEVMDGREVLVLWTGGDPNQPVVVTADSDQGWVCVDRWAEFNKEGGAE